MSPRPSVSPGDRRLARLAGLGLVPLLAAAAVVSGCLVTISGPEPESAAAPLERTDAPPQYCTVRLDQVGYPAAGEKWAAVVADPPARSFTVHRVDVDRKVLSGQLPEAVVDADSGDPVQALDLSALTEPGVYEVRVRGQWRPAGEAAARETANSSGDHSVHLTRARFEVAERPWDDLLRLTMRSYYGQRCGVGVDLGPEHPRHRHVACHLTSGWHPSSGRQGRAAVTGGWHDAGDYGRYVVNSGITTGTLLWAWELQGEGLADLDLGIPESAGGAAATAVPDFLDEVRWNLDWMLAMQDADGGAWHKQTPEAFPGFVMPAEDASANLVIGTGEEPWKSSCATADLAAVAAIAARVYRPHDAAFADRALDAAARAWGWLEEHPAVTFENPDGVVTGEYGDADCSDERLWAAAELWRTGAGAGGGDGAPGPPPGTVVAAITAASRHLDRHRDDLLAAVGPASPPSWAEVGPLAAWSRALGDPDGEVAAAIRDRSRAAADEIARRARRHPSPIPHPADDWVWGSNAVAANYAVQLLIAGHLAEAGGEAPDPAWRAAAADVVHYLLGRNPFSVSWVTGTGEHSVRHPHHRPSGADGIDAPWPGLLAGGPNAHPQDPVLETFRPGTPPALWWRDAEASYAGNEIAINWNAPLVFVLAGLTLE